MKRLLLIALLGLSLAPELAHAQKRRRQAPTKLGLTAGVKAGGAYVNLVGYTPVTGAAAREYAGRVAPVAGGLVNFRFTPQLSAQIEGLYAPRGTELFIGTGTGRTEIVCKLIYLDVPVLFKFNMKIFYVELGGIPSFLLNSSSSTNGGKPVENLAGFNKLDVGYGFGAGVEMPAGWIGGFRYVRSSGSIGAGGPIIGGQALENSALQITGGYIFGHSFRRGRRH